MNKPIATAALSLALAACGQSQQAEETTTAAPETPAKHSGVLAQNINDNVRPGVDFNAYVNGNWMKSAEIPSDRSSTGVGLDTHEQSVEDVKVIIGESAAGDFAKGSDEQKVGDLYASYMDMETRNSLGISPLASEFERIDDLADYKELAVYFAEANKIGVGVPFSLNQYADFKDPKTYMMYAYQGGLGLPDREYYFTDDEKSESIRSVYLEHVATMFELAGLSDGNKAAETIMALETRIAAEHMLKEQTRNMVALYNKIPLEELSDLMPMFAWDEYLAEAGISEIDGLVVMMMDYMKALDEIIVDTSMDDWKTWLKWAVLNNNASLLNDDIDQQNFMFYSNKLRGVEEPLPRWKRAVSNVNANLGEVVGKVYVSRHFPPDAKERMLDLVNNLLKAYEMSIKELDWMGEKTKAEALDKLSKFTPKIGYPDVWKEYGDLEIDGKDLLGNIHRSAIVVYDQRIARQSGPVDRSEWNMTPQTVNAYYSPALNEIVFPAAILQPPFFDLDAEDAINYGAIGAIIGHEIGHGFDDSGSNFDGDGGLRDWWTDQDKEEFKARTAKLVEQYDEFEPYEGLHVNGEFTLGENIGDLGGLSIAVLAYKLSLDGAEAPEIDGFTGLQRVFIGYGQAWRYKAREQQTRTQIATDPHSPAEFRSNGVVRNVPEFYEAFDVVKTDDLYLSPEDRVKIW